MNKRPLAQDELEGVLFAVVAKGPSDERWDFAYDEQGLPLLWPYAADAARAGEVWSSAQEAAMLTDVVPVRFRLTVLQ